MRRPASGGCPCCRRTGRAPGRSAPRRRPARRPTVPSIGSTGSSMRWSLCRAAKATVLRAAVELVDPGRVRQRVLQGDRPVGARHAAEERDRRRGAPVARRLQRHEVQHEGVAGLGALDVERTGLRVDEPQVDLRADRSSTLRSAPPNASSDHSRSAVPGLIRHHRRRPRRTCRRTARGSACTPGRPWPERTSARGAAGRVPARDRRPCVTPSSAIVPAISAAGSRRRAAHRARLRPSVRRGRRGRPAPHAHPARRRPRRRRRTGCRRRRTPRPGRRRRRPPGSCSSGVGARSSWRPPWLETTTASAPASTTARASSAVWMPLTTSGPAQVSRSQARSAIVTAGSNIRAASSATVPSKRLQRRELQRLGGQQVEPPRAGAAPPRRRSSATARAAGSARCGRRAAGRRPPGCRR